MTINEWPSLNAAANKESECAAEDNKHVDPFDDLLRMELHSTLHFDWYEVLRVHGGWIYTRFDTAADMNPQNPCPLSSCFVPESPVLQRQRSISSSETDKC